MNSYELYFILKEESGKVTEWTEMVTPAIYDAEQNKHPLDLTEYFRMRGFTFVDGGYEMNADGKKWRAVNRRGYAIKDEA